MIKRIFEKLLSVEITFIILGMLFGNFIILDQLTVSVMIIIIISGTILLHIVLEKIRWKMYPVYVISLALIALFDFLDSYLKQDFKMDKIEDESLEWLS